MYETSSAEMRPVGANANLCAELGPAQAASEPTPNQGGTSFHWFNFCSLVAIHVVGVVGVVAYAYWHGVTLAATCIALVGAALTTLGISLGYHRLFSHRAYETGPVLRFVLLALGASALQNSAQNWAADHRRHHRHVDTPLDPYDATRGLWYSHLQWILESTPAATLQYPVPDLLESRLVRWQHRHYLAIGVLTGFGLPTLAGYLAGDVWGGLVLGGLVRLIACYHATFSINSLAHEIGDQPYSRRNSSRDSWLAALVTMGEGYHNYHHTFPSDYRNGVRLHQFDPSKWCLFLLERAGAVRNLRRTPATAIARMRLRTDRERIGARAVPPRVMQVVERSREALETSLRQWATLTRAKHGNAWQGATRRRLEAKIDRARRRFERGYRQWRALLRRVERETAAVAPSS